MKSFNFWLWKIQIYTKVKRISWTPYGVTQIPWFVSQLTSPIFLHLSISEWIPAVSRVSSHTSSTAPSPVGIFMSCHSVFPTHEIPSFISHTLTSRSRQLSQRSLFTVDSTEQGSYQGPLIALYIFHLFLSFISLPDTFWRNQVNCLDVHYFPTITCITWFWKLGNLSHQKS